MEACRAPTTHLLILQVLNLAVHKHDEAWLNKYEVEKERAMCHVDFAAGYTRSSSAKAATSCMNAHGLQEVCNFRALMGWLTMSM